MSSINATKGAYQHPQSLVLEWQVPHEANGSRADKYLVYKVGRLSRTHAQHIIKQGDFRSIKGPLKPSQKLFTKETVQLWRFPPDSPLEVNYDVKILYEDDRLLILDKPPHLAIHPTARYLYETLTHWLKLKYSFPPRPCHRLDKETSGVTICAKTHAAEVTLKKAFMKGEVKKTYFAIVRGNWMEQASQGLLLDYPLRLQGEDGLVRIRMVYDAQAGLPSQTYVTALHHCPSTNRTLVKCQPYTGRQHQIRAHLALAGYPIIGDKIYAMGDEFFDAYTKGKENDSLLEHSRHALHAYEVEFTLEGEIQRYRAPFPKDFVVLLGNTPTLGHLSSTGQ